MSKEININFNTELWNSSSWDKMYVYIANFKSRIYKATYQNLKYKKYILQKLLITSPTSRIVAFNIVRETFEESVESEDFNSHKFTCTQKIDVCFLPLELSILFSGAQKSSNEIFKKLELVSFLLIFFALEPEFNARQDQAINFFNVQLPKYAIPIVETIIQNQNEKLYLLNLNLMPYLTNLNIDYIMARLNLCNLLNNILKKRINNILFTMSTSSVDLKILFESDSLNFKLNKSLLRFLAYLLCSEVSYLASSKALSDHLINESHKGLIIINYGSEVLLCHTSKVYLNLWLQVFLKTINLNYLKLKINYYTHIYSEDKFSFLGYYFLHKYNVLVTIGPSKDLQILLLKKIQYLFSKFKGNSATSLISSLNCLLIEWSKYFCVTKACKIFALIDYLIYLKLRSWVFRRHPGWGKTKIINKYFDHRSSNKWFFYTKQVIGNNEKSFLLFKVRDTMKMK